QPAPVPWGALAASGRSRSTLSTPLVGSCPLLDTTAWTFSRSPTSTVAEASSEMTTSGAPITSKRTRAAFSSSTRCSPGAAAATSNVVDGKASPPTYPVKVRGGYAPEEGTGCVVVHVKDAPSGLQVHPDPVKAPRRT